jgi:hypothetical protein
MHPGRFYARRTKGINNNRQQKLQSWRYSKQTNNQKLFLKIMKLSCREEGKAPVWGHFTQ